MNRFLLLPLVILLASCSSKSRKVFDLQKSAVESRSLSAILSGCSMSPALGYLYCEVREGSSFNQKIFLHFPKLECQKESCIEVIWLHKSQNFTASKALEKNEFTTSFLLSDIVGHQNQASLSDDGEYQVLISGWFEGEDSSEFHFQSKGILRLRIIEDDFFPLVCKGIDTAWKLDLSDSCQAHYSTKMRANLCGECRSEAKWVR